MSSAAPKLFVDPVTGDLVTERDLELLAMYDAAVADKEGMAAFGRWYESQPPEWIAEMDELAQMVRRKP